MGKLRNSIKGKILLVSLLLMLGLVVNVTIGIIVQYTQTEKNVEGILNDSLDSSLMLISNGLNNIIVLVKDHANDYEFTNGTAEEKAAHAQLIASFDENVNNLIFMDSEGTSYNGEIPQSILSTLKTSDLAFTTPTDENSVFYLAVKRSDGGILCSEMKAAKLATILAGSAADTFLMTSAGAVIAYDAQNGGPESDYSQYVQKQGTRTVYNSPKGEWGNLHCFAAASLEAGDNWTVLIRVPSGNYYRSINVAFAVNIVVILLMVLLIVLVNIFIAANIIKPLEAVRSKIGAMAQGELSGENIKVRSDDELGQLSKAVNGMADFNRDIIGDIQYYAEEIAKQNLCVKPNAQYVGDYIPVRDALESIVASVSEVVRNVDSAGREVSASSAQMSTNSAVLSQAAVQETDTVNELNNDLHRVHDQINDSAVKAAQARDMTDQAVNAMNEGNEKMSNMLEAMREINATSSEIANIIKTIQDISFQTNILSLNASIEAARAGSAGKGFAVVAGEVGSLASETAEAAKSTTKLIETSLKAVEHGTVIANETAEMLAMIVGKAGESAKVVEEIADASNRQAESIKQVLNGMNSISAAVDQINVSARECADSSQLLASQSAMLHDTVDKFVLDGSAPKTVSGTAASKPAPKPAAASAQRPAAKPASGATGKTVVLSGDEPARSAKPAPASTASKTAAKPVSTWSQASAKTAPKTAAAKPAAPAKAPATVKPAAPAKPAAPVKSAAPAKSASKPVIKLDDDEGFTPAPAAGGNPVSKATMQPVKHTINLDSNKY